MKSSIEIILLFILTLMIVNGVLAQQPVTTALSEAPDVQTITEEENIILSDSSFADLTDSVQVI